jgi:prophage antirepressor-like protein
MSRNSTNKCENVPTWDELEFILATEIDGKPYFVGTDVAKALGYSNPRKAILDHCKGVTKRDTPTSSGIQSMSYINEGDLYRLIMKSKLPSAEKFESWVMDEVLPTIRKTGSYQKPLTTVEQIQVIATGFLDHEERLNRLENTMTIDYAQQESIRDLVSSVVIAHLGGKESISIVRIFPNSPELKICNSFISLLSCDILPIDGR